MNKIAKEVEKPEDAAAVIKQYEDIIRTKKKVLCPSHIIKEKFSKIQGQGMVYQTSQ